MALFFFSSRRRHTRCSRDWSSDVCSSDLVRSIVLREDDDTGPGEVSDKAPEVRYRRAAPAVDCLIIIANGGAVRVPGTEQPHDLELGPGRGPAVGDEDGLVLPLEPGAHARAR